MSGIFGLVSFGGRPIEPDQLEGMSDAPREPVVWRDGLAGIGHGDFGGICREGDLVLVADGHVDARRELAAALRITASDARTMSAAALLLRAYQRWGNGCPDQLVGDFAFALWNRRTRMLTAACSAPVARPLYFHTSTHGFAFASLPRALFTMRHIKRRVDEERIASFLTGADTGSCRSFFADVRLLPPGELLVLTGTDARVSRWWQPDVRRRLELAGDDEYVEAFAELFATVIDDHVAGNGETGVLLSGGLDSGAVAAEAAPLLHRRGRRLAAYTAVPPAGFDPLLAGRFADEAPIAETLVRRHPNVDLTLVRDREGGLLHDAMALFDASGAPFRNAANRGWMEAIYARASEDGVRTLLNGDQGNLTISWDGSGLLAELLRQGKLVRLLREAQTQVRMGPARVAWRTILSQAVRPLLPRSVNVAVAVARGTPGARDANPYARYSLIAPAFAARLHLAERDKRRRARSFDFLEGDGRKRRLAVLTGTARQAAALQAGYRARFGVNTRVPLADRRLLEFCLALPESQCARDGETRLLIRRAMAGRLPQQTFDARLRGLQAADWFERMTAERSELLAAVGRFEADELTREILDLPRLRRLLQDLPSEAPTSAADFAVYRGAIGVAMMTGAFLLWTQQS